MKKIVDDLFCDLNDTNLPKDYEMAFVKIKCGLLINGKRIYWYYKNERDFIMEIDGKNGNPRDYNYWSGIIVAKPGIEKAHTTSDMEIEDCIICIDWHPCEKCYPEVGWIALNRLLDDENLV